MAVRLAKELIEDDPAVLAPQMGLLALTDHEAGWTRRVCGRGFSYQDVDGHTLTGVQRLRAESLVIPPAWEDVWVCADERGYLQATGVDDAGRKQYRYHSSYVTFMEQRKFQRLAYFSRALRAVRRAVEVDLRCPVGSRRFAVATAVALIDQHLLRVGNEDSAAEGHYGATTLSPQHLDQSDARDQVDATLEYRAKSGQERHIEINDEDLVGVLTNLSDRADDRLLWFADDSGLTPAGVQRPVTATAVNEFVRTHAGNGFSTKDFRTWGGSAVALEALIGGADEVEAVDVAAEALGNTRAVARSSYIHPLVLASNADELKTIWKASRASRFRSRREGALAKLLAAPP